MTPFEAILRDAEKRKGGKETLAILLPSLPPADFVEQKDDSFFLSMMCKVVNQAGFNWTVIERKWPQFEEAFLGFDVHKLSMLSPEAWETYEKDARIVRHWPKIKAFMENVEWVRTESERHGSFADFMKQWTPSQQVECMAYLKKYGSRLGGMSGQWFLRYCGKDSFVLTRDVVAALQASGLDIKDQPSSKREMKLIQECFNGWHQETGLPYTHLSRIAAFSIGDNHHHMI
ncbi:MAG: DNA-3-methyladenine glycosylase I [Rickettsiales bacterium]|nr:DNA-3-methyladenine glycosylase I [Rickettsiales bacterium]